MNFNTTGIPAFPPQNFSVTSTDQTPTYSTTTLTQASPEVPQVFSYTAPVSPQASVMTSTQQTPPQTPQQLAQSPIDAVASLLINSESEDLTARLFTQTPLANLFDQVMSLLGLKQEASAESSKNNPALVNLKAIIENSRPDYKALKQQITQALEAKSQGQDSPNALIKSAVDQALTMFQGPIKASGSLMHFMEVENKRESLVQVAAGLAYQATLVSSAYSQISSSSLVQNLHNSRNAQGLHNLLNNLTIACMQYGAPAEAMKLVEISSQAILNMVKTIMQASDHYARAMGMNTIEQANQTNPANRYQPSYN
jgi:hypothetical protein